MSAPTVKQMDPHTRLFLRIVFMVWLAVIVVAAIGLFAAKSAHAASGMQSAQKLAPTGQIQIIGTLETTGTFAYEVAPVYTSLAVSRLRAANALNRHQLTIRQAEQVQVMADQAHTLLNLARAKEDYVQAARAKSLSLSIQTLLSENGVK